MKKLFIAVLMLLTINCVYSQNVVREGKTFKTERVSKSDTLRTDYTWESGGKRYPIIVNKNSGACYVIRISKKTGKPYKYYLKESICKIICKELNINYKPKK